MQGHHGPRVLEGSLGGVHMLDLRRTPGPHGAVWGGTPGPPRALPGFPAVPDHAGPTAAPKMASGLCMPRASGVQVVHRACKSPSRARTSRASSAACAECAPSVRRARAERAPRREHRPVPSRRRACKPRALATPAGCKQRAPSGVRSARGPGERAAARSPSAALAAPFPPPKADSLRVALSAERLPCDYPSDNVLIVLLALCQANLNCISILQHLFSAITIWINLKL